APTNYDMTAFDQAHRMRQRLPDHGVRHRADPRSGSIDQDARRFHLASASGIQHELPLVSTFDPCAAGASPNDRAMLSSIQCVKHNQSRIIDRAIGIFEAVAKSALQRLADWVMGEIDRTGCRK